MLRRTASSMALLALLLPIASPAPAQPQAQPLAEEVPFITTPDNVTLAMLQLARVRPGDHVIDLGSGDGRIVITAARRFGASGLGVEIVPDLVARSRTAAQQAGVAAKVEFREQDLFKTDLSRASVITMYLLPEVNLQLRPALLQLAPGTRIVSHDWDLGDWLPDETLTVDAPDKTIGREKKSRLHRWVVPAPVAGLWCGEGNLRWQISQQYQIVQLRWQQGPRGWTLPGRLDGTRLQLLGAAPGPLRWQVRGDELVAGTRRLRRGAGEAC
ncbi:MAG: methyltransferase domain-containing protein [Rubrivivax sp.]